MAADQAATIPMPWSSDIPAVYRRCTWPGSLRRRPAPQRADAGTLARLEVHARYICGQPPGGDISRGAKARTMSRSARPAFAIPTALQGGQRGGAPGRLAGGNRAAVPQTLGEKLAHQQGGHVRAQMTGAKHPLYNARASLARSARPASVTVSRTARPAISAPAFPAARIPGNRAGRRADTCGCTLDSAANVKLGTPPEWAPEPRQAATHTAPWPRFPSAIRPWTPQHNALQRYKVTHAGTEKKRPARARHRS